MVEKYYGFTLKQLIGFYLLIAVVGYFVILFVPVTSQGQTLFEILFTAPDIVIPTMPEPQELTTTVTEEGEMIISEPTSAFCQIYPTFAVCR